MISIPFGRSSGVSRKRQKGLLEVFLKLQLILLVIECCSCSKSGRIGAGVDEGSRLASSAVVTGELEGFDGDIVGWGEDCSTEGPFCDKRQHLTCDPVEEVCTCDVKEGYVNADDVPGLGQRILRVDEYGNEYVEGVNNHACISKKELEEKTEELLGLRKSSEGHQKPKEVVVEEKVQESGREAMGSMLEEIMKELEDSGRIEKSEEYDGDRLMVFKPRKKADTKEYLMQDLIVEEILKYGRRGKVNLQEWKETIRDLVMSNYAWHEHKLANSLCNTVFDVDQDRLSTPQEYVISIMSKPVHEIVVQKVFLSLISSLPEENCISIEDLQALDHYPETLRMDFVVLDSDADGCFSLDEFRTATDEVCRNNWFAQFLKEYGLESFMNDLDPTPEEMYIRRIIENERLSINWELIDSDKDGLLSYQELYRDLQALGSFSEESEDDDDEHIETSLLLHFLDKNDDGFISMQEVKIQISHPDFIEDYQVEWLESLYELYETDEPEVKEYLQILLNNYKELRQANPNFKTDKIFEMFDKNRDGEMDEVELRLLMEILKKYVVYYMLNATVTLLDLDSDRKLSLSEYEEFVKNASLNFRIYFRNLLTQQNYGEDEALNDDEEDEDYDEESEEQGTVVLSKKATRANETMMIQKMFMSLDSNTDGFISKEDFYYHISSYHNKKTEMELRQDFAVSDTDNNGILNDVDSDEIMEPMTFEDFKEAYTVYAEEVDEEHFKSRFILLDANGDSIVQFDEFTANKGVIINSDDEPEFIEWLEEYFGSSPSQMNREGEKVFREFDSNCDGFVSQTEFKSKVDELYRKSRITYSYVSLTGEANDYFNRLDLSKDGKLSYNEFHFLLLRKGSKIDGKL